MELNEKLGWDYDYKKLWDYDVTMIKQIKPINKFKMKLSFKNSLNFNIYGAHYILAIFIF